MGVARARATAFCATSRPSYGPAMRRAGQCCALLWASQAAIYKWYGFAMATESRSYTIDSVDIGFADFVRYRITENIDDLSRGTVEILCEGLEVVDCSTCSRLSSNGAGSSANRNGCFKFTPAPNFHGDVLFKYTAAIDDPNGKFISAPSPMGVRIEVSIEHLT